MVDKPVFEGHSTEEGYWSRGKRYKYYDRITGKRYREVPAPLVGANELSQGPYCFPIYSGPDANAIGATSTSKRQRDLEERERRAKQFLRERRHVRKKQSQATKRRKRKKRPNMKYALDIRRRCHMAQGSDDPRHHTLEDTWWAAITKKHPKWTRNPCDYLPPRRNVYPEESTDNRHLQQHQRTS